jgi:hypothetical protein
LRNPRSVASFLGVGVSKGQNTEKAEEKEERPSVVPVEEKKVDHKVQVKEEEPPVVKGANEVKSGPPPVGSAPLTCDTPDRTDELSPEYFTAPTGGVVTPPSEASVQKLDVAKAEFETGVRAESGCNLRF